MQYFFFREGIHHASNTGYYKIPLSFNFPVSKF